MVESLRDSDNVQKHKQQPLHKALNIQYLCSILSKMPSSVIILKAA